jgi:hypothetical protein
MPFRVAILALLTTLASPAAAQDMPTVLPNNYVLSDILNSQRIDTAIGPRRAQARAPARSTRKAGNPPTTRAVTSYRPSPAVSARVRRQFVAAMAGKIGAAKARPLAAAIEHTDPVTNWSQLVAADGLRTGDMADALTSYWVLNWVMANNADSNRAQVLAVREQVRTILAANPRHAALGEAQRQEMSETFILNFLVQHAAYTDALKRGDRAIQRRLGDAAAARFRDEMGVDLRRLRLGDTGFVPVG